MIVQIIASCSGPYFSYSPGEEVELSPEQAADFIKLGLAVAVAPVEPETATVKPKAETRKK